MRFIVQHTQIKHEGKVYVPGNEIDLPTETAERLGEYLLPVGNKKKKEGGLTDAEGQTAHTGKS